MSRYTKLALLTGLTGMAVLGAYALNEKTGYADIMIGSLTSDFGALRPFSGTLGEAEGYISALPDPSAGDVTGEDVPDLERIAAEASVRLGYVPEGGSPEDLKSLPGRPVRADPLLSGFLSPSALNTDQGAFRLHGVSSVLFADNCIGKDDLEFSCYDWVMEGLDILVANSRGLRCLVVEEDPEIEMDMPQARCESNIGGDWIDISQWSVERGLNFAEGADLAPFEMRARERAYGLWSVTYIAYSDEQDAADEGENDEDPADEAALEAGVIQEEDKG